MSKHPFVKKDDYQKTGAKDKQRAKVLAVIEQASKCMEHEDFKLYSKAYHDIRDHLLGAILNCQEQDPIKYASEVKSLIDRYKAVSMLFNDVKTHASKNIEGVE